MNYLKDMSEEMLCELRDFGSEGTRQRVFAEFRKRNEVGKAYYAQHVFVGGRVVSPQYAEIEKLVQSVEYPQITTPALAKDFIEKRAAA